MSANSIKCSRLQEVKGEIVPGKPSEAQSVQSEAQSVQSVAEYALSLNDRKIRAFTIQKEACQKQAEALTLQRESWDQLLEWASSLMLLRSQLQALQKLHLGLTMGIDADLKFHSGLEMKLDAELEEYIVVQEGIRGQVEQMKKQREQEESRIVVSQMAVKRGGN